MASMVPYRSVFGVRPSASSLFDLFDDMTDLANNSIASKAFPVDVEDISSAVFIGHGHRHAGADACAIVGVYGDVS